MAIVYVAATCSEAAYAGLYADTQQKPAFQAQKYHRLFIEGLAAHTDVHVVCYPPSNPSVMKANTIDLPDEKVGRADYRYLRVYRNPLRKLMHLVCGSFLRTLPLLDCSSAVIVDCLNPSAALGALLASRIRGARCVGILTDLPEFLGEGPDMKLSRFVISHCTDYVVMTEAMNTRVNHTGKPHVVLEGHADISMADCVPVQKTARRKICMYAGSIHEIYGIRRLVEGFRMASLPDTELHIYGSGDYLETLKSIAAEDSRIVYGGMLLPGQVVEKEREADLLINPRPTDEEYVKYSFPSKTMEYMSTGTPLLTTALPGLPEEYYPHIYIIREETPEGIARSLREVFSESVQARYEKGCAARNFVLGERNNIIQASKVLEMLRGTGT